MSRTLRPLGVLILPLLLTATFNATTASTTNTAGQFAKYKLTEQVAVPGLIQTTFQNVTETVVSVLSNGTLVDFRVQVGTRIIPFEQFIPSSSMVFPYLGPSTLSNPNTTINQISESFNLTFIQPNSTSTSRPFKLTNQDIGFNSSTYAGNLYSGRLSLIINVTRAFNINQTIPPLPFNIDLSVETFSTDLLYNLTGSTSVNLPGYQPGTVKAQMILLSTNLSIGDPIQPLLWYTALIVIPIGVVGYLFYRKRHASRLAKQTGEKPSYWVR